MPVQVQCICMFCRAKHSNGLLVSPATRTRHKRQEQEVLRWSSIQSTTISSNQGNFSMMARQDDALSEQHLIADQTDYLEPVMDEIDEEEEAGGEDEDEEEETEGEDEEEEIEREETKDLGKNLIIWSKCIANEYIIKSGLEVSENLVKGLRLFHIKEKHNLTEAAFNDILREMNLFDVSLYRLHKALEWLVPFEPILVDCCINSCIAYTKEYENLEICPICEKTRYKAGKRIARKQAAYWSPIFSLRMQYQDRKNAEIL